MKKVMALLLAVVMVLALAACGSSAPAATAAPTAAPAQEAAPAAEQTTEAVVEQAASEAPGDAGFEEIPIFEDIEADFINVNAVYFQPVPMAPGQENYEDFDLHIEADVSAMENSLGYGVGDWIPYLTIDYTITGSNGEVAAQGTFMHMAASDGPHYGANIKLPNADTYTIDFAIHSPGEMGYLIHSDAETGPGGLLDDVWGDGPLTVHYEGWDYVPQEW